jgi:predicted ATPase
VPRHTSKGTAGRRSVAQPGPLASAYRRTRRYTSAVGQASASNLIILTGAPGSGKTAILSRLSSEFHCVGEPAREVLAEQRATGGTGTWDQDPSLFVHLLLQRSIEKYEVARRSGETVIFDRGVPDCVAYSVRADVDPASSLAAIEKCRYRPRVLFLQPWGDIYETDEERVMSFEDAISFSETLRDVYERSGYTLVDVPYGSVDDRVAFVRQGVAR